MKQTDRLILAARIFDAVYQMTLMQEKDNNPDHWKTINGAHVHVDENGNYDGGAGGLFNGKHHYGKGYKEKAEKDRQKTLKESIKEKRSWEKPRENVEYIAGESFKDWKRRYDKDIELSNKQELAYELKENWKDLYKEELTTENLVKRVNERYEKEIQPGGDFHAENPWAEEQRQKEEWERQKRSWEIKESDRKWKEQAEKKEQERRNKGARKEEDVPF